MELVLLCAVIAWMVKYGVTDAVAACKGDMPGRWKRAAQREKHRLDRKTAKAGQAKPRWSQRGAARRYVALLYNDALNDMAESHTAKRQARKNGQKPPSRAPAWFQTLTGLVGAAAVKRRDAKDSAVDADSEASGPAPADSHAETPATTVPPPEPAAATSPIDATAATASPQDTAGGAKILPFDRAAKAATVQETAHNNKENHTMSQNANASAEVTNLPAAQEFYNTTATQLADFGQQVEMGANYLAQHQVTGKPVELSALLQEQLNMASSTASEIKAALDEQNQLREAHLNLKGEGGSKEFVTGG